MPVDVAALQRVEPGPAPIKEVDLEAPRIEIVATTIVPSAVTGDAVQKDDAGPRRVDRVPDPRHEPAAIASRVKIDSR
jgi:hypothetical protein